MPIIIIIFAGLGGLVIGLIIGYFLAKHPEKAKQDHTRRRIKIEEKRFREYAKTRSKLEEKKFRQFAKQRIREGKKLPHFHKFQFKYIPMKKQAELLEEIYFISIAEKYLKEDKLALINDFEFKHLPLEQQAKLLETYRNR